MPLVVNHNPLAKNVASNLDRHYSKLATSTQRLSSGLRINSAADDAAGLAIRELMRADISALHQGMRNINDAISMIQTADSALAIIDEKLIRMKELAEQAATGTYDSVQRIMINSEFVQMAAEIDRIANATDFNGIHLLNGNLSGSHDGTGLNSTGKMKIHFGSGNDSAEDYYYVEIGNATTKGLGLNIKNKEENNNSNVVVTLNDIKSMPRTTQINLDSLKTIQELFPNQGEWKLFSNGNSIPNSYGLDNSNVYFKIPSGTKNIVINANGHYYAKYMSKDEADNDIQLYTMGAQYIQLAGSHAGDEVFNRTALSQNKDIWGFGDNTPAAQDGVTNYGLPDYNGTDITFNESTYNGMTIRYTGDTEYHDSNPNNMRSDDYLEYEILTIDEAKEDLIVWYPGVAAGMMKVYYELDDDTFNNLAGVATENAVNSIDTQEGAQRMLVKIDQAIVAKDKIRANLGALQNRLENSMTNLTTQAENLQSAESRISDIDYSSEMTNFVRNQILAQSAVAMLSQANSLPQMAMQLIGS